jgi:hypothetical protein
MSGDRVEVHVAGHWCELEPDCLTVEQAFEWYSTIEHPDLGDIVVVPSNYPLRGPSVAELVATRPLEIPGSRYEVLTPGGELVPTSETIWHAWPAPMKRLLEAPTIEVPR